MPESYIDQLRAELAAKDAGLREVQEKLSQVEEELARLQKTAGPQAADQTVAELGEAIFEEEEFSLEEQARKSGEKL